MSKKDIKPQQTTKQPDVFNIAGVEYKMVGINDDGTPILKSLNAIKQEQDITAKKKQFKSLILFFLDKGIDLTMNFTGTNQFSIEIFDNELKKILHGSL